MPEVADLKNRLVTNREFRVDYDKADAEFVIVEALVHDHRSNEKRPRSGGAYVHSEQIPARPLKA